MLFSLIKEINRLWKEINRSLSKGLSYIYLKVTLEKKWNTQNLDFLSLKISSPGQFLRSSNSRRYQWIFRFIFKGLGAKLCLDFPLFYFERNHEVLKSKSLCFLLKKYIKFYKNKTEWKMENPTRSFRGINHVLQLVWELQIKCKTVMSWISEKKKQFMFCNVHFFRGELFQHLCFILIYNVLNKFLEYICFYIYKKITSYTLVACFKFFKILQCILKHLLFLILHNWIYRT